MSAPPARRKQRTPWQSQRRVLQQDGAIGRFRLNRSQLSLPTASVKPTAVSQSISLNVPVELDSLRTHKDKDDKVKENDRISAILLARHFDKSSLLNGHIGGLRDDPLNAFPIESKGHIPSAFDYFTQVYAPVSVCPADTSMTQTELFSIYFKTMLHDATFFELIIAFSIGLQLHRRNSKAPMTAPVMHHVNNSMLRLRDKLASAEEGNSDTVVLTIVILAGINHMFGNFDALKSHVSALRYIIATRGGIDSLGWSGYLKLKVTRIMKAWDALQKVQLQVCDTPLPSPDPTNTLQYPTHPFTPDLCLKISKFPPALRELGLSGSLSFQTLDLVSIVIVQMGQRGFILDSPTVNNLIWRPDLKPAERLIIIATLVYINYLERVVIGYENPISEIQLHLQLKFLSDKKVTANVDPSLLAWLALMLRGMTDSEEIRAWAEKILDSMKIDERKEKELERAYLPIPKKS